MKIPTDQGWNSGSMGVAPSYRSRIAVAVVLTLGAVGLLGIVILLILLMMSTPAVSPAPTGVPSQSPSAKAYDPYPVYFVNSPRGLKHLTRPQALERAIQGCGQTYPPGTVDAALADAYRPAGICK